MAARTAQMLNTIRPHVPLIKFRKGTPIASNIEAPSSSTTSAAPIIVQQVAAPATNQSTVKSKSIVQSHEWWETPFKFKKRQIDQLEMDIINSGGSDKLYC